MENIFKEIWFRISQSQVYGAAIPYIKMGINMGMLITFPMYGFLWWGILGFFAGILLFIGIKVFFMRKLFMESVRGVERKLFGKSLDKDQWEKGEFQRPKIVWKKKKGVD